MIAKLIWNIIYIYIYMNVDVAATTKDLPEGGNSDTVTQKPKRKRRFKRKFLQPKRSRKRWTRQLVDQTMEENIPEGWNGILKIISGQPVTKIEESLFLKGKKFCPVEKDPPIIRMQRELNTFFRMFRIQWHFRGQKDERSDVLSKVILDSPQSLCRNRQLYIHAQWR